ncbi:Uncharacterised protein [Pseudomonas aeruginosa]|nr:Uncharacterised protein [Pseudomonas aeruginosa]
MMSRRARFLLLAVLLLLAGLLAIFLASRLQPYTETIDLGPSPEARRNPYLAAELFLRKQGVTVSRADGLEVLKELPPSGHTLLLLGSRSGMTPGQARRLLQWSEQGGHLVLIAERLWDEDEKKSGDLLLDSLDIRQYLTEDFDDSQDRASEETADADADEGSVDDHATEAPPEDTAGEEEEPADSVPDYSALTRLYLENERSPAYIGFDPDYHLYDPQNHAYAWANSGDATHLLQMQHGKGLVTVLTDAWIWQNRNIEQYDNAWLLWYLTQDNQVTLLYRAERDSLATLLARHFPRPWRQRCCCCSPACGAQGCARVPCSRWPAVRAGNWRNTCAPAPTSSSASAATSPCCTVCNATSCAGRGVATPVSNSSASPSNGRSSGA